MLYHHTHWDREWWSTREEFRLRLVHLMDALLDQLERDPRLGTFVLDGQMIMLGDYLELRPQERDRLVRLIKQGRLHVGPWYVLADEVLPSGEACIRNLWLGERAARQLGVPTMAVGYLPDQFGHTGQMPQILRGFGIDSAVAWRGFSVPPKVEPDDSAGDGSGSDPRGVPGADEAATGPGERRRIPARMQSEFWWEAPDGSRVLGVYLALEYSQRVIRARVFDPEITRAAAVKGMKRLVDCLRPYATTDCVLVPYGGDHMASDSRLPDLVADLNRCLGEDGIDVEIGSLAGYLDALRSAACNPKVVWRGEARVSGGRANVLPGVLSSRLPQKRANANVQVTLERYAEPLQALAWLLGGQYEATALWHAWERLVQNHAHDSITGCSIDLVHREIDVRIAVAGQLADLLALRGLDTVARHVDDADLPAGARCVVVFNPIAAERTDVVRLLLDRGYGIEPGTWRLTDPNGVEVPFQVRLVSTRRPARPTAESLELTFVASGVPGLGYRRYALSKRDAPASPTGSLPYAVAGVVAVGRGAESPTGLAIGPWHLENDLLEVEVDRDNGALTITDRRTGEIYSSLNVLVDGGDSGDTYTYSWPLGDREVSTRKVVPRIEWLETGPARATLRIAWTLRVPAALTDDRLSRSASDVDLEASSDVSLSPGVPRVDVHTRVMNTARDHRLRTLLPLGRHADRSWAEAPFEVVERPTGYDGGERGRHELAGIERPQQTFASVSCGSRGLTVANRGLPEFSVSDDENGTIALTLLRSVGYLSRDDLLTRAGRAGPTIPTPDAQLQGLVEADYAIVPHAGDWQAAASHLQAHAFNAPLMAALRLAIVPGLEPGIVPGTANRGVVLPPEAALVLVEGDVVVTALKRGEDDPVLILRLLRLGDSPAIARVRTLLPMGAARIVDLRERVCAGRELREESDGGWTTTVGPWELVTIALTPRTTGSAR
jgi:mannosylglycerate hydrolase